MHQESDKLAEKSEIEQLHDQLAGCGQGHVLRYWEELDVAQRDTLKKQLNNLDLSELATMLQGEDEKTDYAAIAVNAEPPPAVRADGSGADWTPEMALQRGEQALRAGEVGAVIVAGGQGTRLGFDQPKGMFPVGPVSERTLFQFFADRLLAVNDHYGCRIPIYVMTSDATDEETRTYFLNNDFFGLPKEDVRIFKQGTMPAVDSVTGKLLLASPGSLALSPDGHGGTVTALERNGCLQDAIQRKVKHLAYIQVDNPLANLCDPTLIGHHLIAESEMTTQVVRKRYAMEKVGNVVLVDGQLQIIEYSDLPESAARRVDSSGELKLWAGNIAVHVFDVDFLQRMSKVATALPFHRASKRVKHLDFDGNIVDPDEPNATKFERFIFDLLPAAKNAFVVESFANEAFAPVKNAEGAPADTPSQARQAISKLHRDWLEQAGAWVGEGVQVEINPRFALSAAVLKGKITPKLRIASDRYFDA